MGDSNIRYAFSGNGSLRQALEMRPLERAIINYADERKKPEEKSDLFLVAEVEGNFEAINAYKAFPLFVCDFTRFFARKITNSSGVSYFDKHIDELIPVLARRYAGWDVNNHFASEKAKIIQLIPSSGNWQALALNTVNLLDDTVAAQMSALATLIQLLRHPHHDEAQYLSQLDPFLKSAYRAQFKGQIHAFMS